MTTIRFALASIFLCCFVYVIAIYGFARATNPEQTSGSLIKNAKGEIIGSRLIAQSFTSGRYFHSRPSACDYNARGAAGSNISPTNPKLAARATEIIAANSVTSENPIPADLVTASGSGLDPHISAAAARFQTGRVAAARNLEPVVILKLIEKTERPLLGKFGGAALVNVLELNLALDAVAP